MDSFPDPDLARRMAELLAELSALRRSVARLEYQTVELVRASGASWETIGENLDPPLSRQAAARKFSQPRGRRIT